MPQDPIASFEPRPAEGLNHPSALHMFLARVRRAPDLTALRFKYRGTWRSLTWGEWLEASSEIAAGLIQDMGLKRGDRVALMSGTRMEWALCDVAIAMAGAVSVPVYPTVGPPEARHIWRDAGCTAAIVEDPDQLRRLLTPLPTAAAPDDAIVPPDSTPRSAAGPILGLEAPVAYLEDFVDLPPHRGGGRVELEDLAPAPANARSFDALRASGRLALEANPDVLEARMAGTSLRDIFTIVYTSGTTGLPKGAVLTNRNFVYESWAIKNTIAVDQTDEHLMILPMSHIFGRHIVWAAIESGAITAFAEDMDSVAANMREVAPSFVGGVPRVFEKMRDAIFREGRGRGRLRRLMFDRALDVGRKASGYRQRGEVMPVHLAAQLMLAERTVFEEVRTMFGGRLRFFFSGAAPLSRELAEFFHAVGILVLEGYGLTETTGATNVNRPDRFRLGTVGPALPGCEVLIADDGEILVRGHNVMRGYHGRPDETTAMIDADGWLHTGDVGEINDGFLRITDRKKDIIITAGGKNIAPQKLEKRLRERKGISHAVVVGDRRPYLIALVTLERASMMRVAEREGLGCKSYDDLVQHPRIRKIVQGYVDDLNASLATYETIKRFAIPPTDFTEAGGELTPSLKVRRNFVRGKYRDLIDSLYEAGPRPQRRI